MTISNNEENRDLIIEKASIVFAENGLKKTTMDTIAQSVFKAKSSLYYYFKSKEEIFLAVLERENDYFKNEITRFVGDETLYQYKLRAFILNKERLLSSLTNLKNVLNDQFSRNYDFASSIILSFNKFEKELFQSILLRFIEDHKINCQNIDLLTDAFLQALNGYFNVDQGVMPIERKETLLDEMIRLLLGGIKSKD